MTRFKDVFVLKFAIWGLVAVPLFVLSMLALVHGHEIIAFCYGAAEVFACFLAIAIPY